MNAPSPISMEQIKPPRKGRPLVDKRVGVLAQSMAAIGLRTPITVRPTIMGGGGPARTAYEIITGRHRHAAAKLLQWTEIDAVIMDGSDDDAELWEIDENFARAELTDAQRADHHTRRERILITKGVVSRGRGGDQSEKSSLRSYAAQTADDLGVSKRTVEKDLARGKKIDPEVLADVEGTDLDKGVVLDLLARTPRGDQAAKVAEIREHQEADKLNRYADKAVARTSAEEAAEIIHANLDLDQVDALMARLASVTMKDFLGALSGRRAA